MLDHRFGAIALALSLAGCITKPIVRPYPERTAADVRADLQKQAAAMRTIRASARAEYDGPGLQDAKVSVSLLAVRGGRLRIDAEAPMGGALATLVADGARFAMLDVRENRFLSGPAEACNVARLLQVTLAPDEIIDILLGGAPLDGEPLSLYWDPKKGHEVVELQRANGSRLRLRAAPRAGGYDLVSAEVLHPDGGVLHRIEHLAFIDRGNGLRLPQRTNVRDLLHKKAIYLRYKEVEPNIEPPEAAFDLKAPSGVPAQEVTCR